MGGDALRDELTALELELHHPGVRCSRERRERLLHPEFHEVGRSGARYDRETIVRYLASVEKHPRVESKDFQVAAVAPDCALLTYRSVQLGEAGERMNAALRSSLWLRTPAGWQLRYHQGTPAPAGP